MQRIGIARPPPVKTSLSRSKIRCIATIAMQIGSCLSSRASYHRELVIIESCALSSYRELSMIRAAHAWLARPNIETRIVKLEQSSSNIALF
uniref:Uncharacterized protein n=1 Tax=Paenarthrobacter aurescens TaxID=43663 RepID=Q6SKD1_PAEAU|nr:hypothetical protein [Paenarthrobacter aurescens]